MRATDQPRLIPVTHQGQAMMRCRAELVEDGGVVMIRPAQRSRPWGVVLAGVSMTLVLSGVFLAAAWFAEEAAPFRWPITIIMGMFLAIGLPMSWAAPAMTRRVEQKLGPILVFDKHANVLSAPRIGKSWRREEVSGLVCLRGTIESHFGRETHWVRQYAVALQEDGAERYELVIAPAGFCNFAGVARRFARSAALPLRTQGCPHIRAKPGTLYFFGHGEDSPAITRRLYGPKDACPHCGYSTKGLPSEMCPECGKDTTDMRIVP